jgi:small subunit ribosomal protein S10e
VEPHGIICKRMIIPTKVKYQIKRYLLKNLALLVEDTPLGEHAVLKLPMPMVESYMRRMVSYGYVERIFVWRHAYYFLTPLGQSKLEEELVFSEASGGQEGQRESLKEGIVG